MKHDINDSLGPNASNLHNHALRDDQKTLHITSNNNLHFIHFYYAKEYQLFFYHKLGVPLYTLYIIYFPLLI